MITTTTGTEQQQQLKFLNNCTVINGLDKEGFAVFYLDGEPSGPRTDIWTGYWEGNEVGIFRLLLLLIICPISQFINHVLTDNHYYYYYYNHYYNYYSYCYLIIRLVLWGQQTCTFDVHGGCGVQNALLLLLTRSSTMHR